MAIGDAAAAAGIPVVPSTKDLKLGFQDINNLADALAAREKALSDRLTALESYKSTTPTPKFTNTNAIASYGSALTSTTQLIIESGTVVVNLDAAGEAYAAFKNPMPNGIVSLVLTNGDTNARPGQVFGLKGTSPSGFTVSAAGSGAGSSRFNYVAIGW